MLGLILLRLAAGWITVVIVAVVVFVGVEVMPGDACTVEGQILPLGNGAIQCVNGVWL